MKLYYHPISGHAHRAYLFLSLIGVQHELIEVNLAAGAHKAPDYLKLNRFGQIPVLDDNGTIVADSNAILVYLAKKYRKTDWLPETPEGAAAVQRWLSVAAGQIAFGPALARVANLFNRPINKEEVLGRAHAVLKVIDDELAGRNWIAAANPTIADVALYSYIARAGEGDVDLSPYANVNAWLARIEALPGFVEFRKTPMKKAG